MIRMAALALAMMMCATATAAPRIIGYYPLWMNKSYPIERIPGDRLTHLVLGFAKIGTLGNCQLSDREPEIEARRKLRAQLASLREAHPDLKVLISIGGWSGSARFTDIAFVSESRRKFAASTAELLNDLELDGLDIDWEFPVARWKGDERGRPEDRANFIKLLAELSAAIKKDHPERVLTCAISASPFHLQHLDLPNIMMHADWLHVMTYDLWGSWSERTGFHAPLAAPKMVAQPEQNVMAHIESLRQLNVPPEKIMLGIPFYGRGVIRVPDENLGMNQLHGGPARGTREDELFAFADLLENYFPKIPAYWDREASAGWLYNPDNGLLITFEDQRSVKAKMDYVRKLKLGGVMIWEITQDAVGPNSLLEVIHKELSDQ